MSFFFEIFNIKCAINENELKIFAPTSSSFDHVQDSVVSNVNSGPPNRRNHDEETKNVSLISASSLDLSFRSKLSIPKHKRVKRQTSSTNNMFNEGNI